VQQNVVVEFVRGVGTWGLLPIWGILPECEVKPDFPYTCYEIPRTFDNRSGNYEVPEYLPQPHVTFSLIAPNILFCVFISMSLVEFHKHTNTEHNSVV
jgi:hypothetical protein